MTKELKYRRISGQRFGLIELIEKRELRGKNHLWLVKCHGCGKEYVRSSSFKSSTVSCGCQMKRRNNESPNWRGVGEISSTIVHKHVNMMKLDHDQKYFLKVCRLISDKSTKMKSPPVSCADIERDPKFGGWLE